MTKVDAQQLTRLRDRIRDTLDQLDDTTIAELARRSDITPSHDGYPAGVGNGTTSGGDISRPTETVAIDNADGTRRPDHDPQQTAIHNIRRALIAMAREGRTASHALDLIHHITDSRRGRETSVATCICCDRTVTGVGNDRIRAGLCVACTSAWHRWKTAGHPHDRMLFIAARKAQLAGEHAAGLTLQGNDVDDEIDALRNAGVLPAATEAS